MDLLKAEIERKRKASAALRERTADGRDETIGSSKFIRRGVLKAVKGKDGAKIESDDDEGRDKNETGSNLSKNKINGDGEGDANSVEEMETSKSSEDGYKDKEKSLNEDSIDNNNNNKDDTQHNKRKKPRKEYDPSVMIHKIPGLSSEKIVYKYFNMLLDMWERDLEMRSNEEKQSMQGRAAQGRLDQCRDHIKPLFKLCKRKGIPDDILTKLVKVVQHCEEGNFRAANDQYILIAIGNSPWPIGVTSVGIHERSAREKIGKGDVAHVMNSELQRKYITSVKRLITFNQSKRPDIPPSMKVQ
jgi:pre-mRNA-splicing factor 18